MFAVISSSSCVHQPSAICVHSACSAGSGSAASAAASSPSLIRSWITIETQKIISSMHGLVMVESMKSEEVELNLTCGDAEGVEPAETELVSGDGASACSASTCGAQRGRVP